MIKKMKTNQRTSWKWMQYSIVVMLILLLIIPIFKFPSESVLNESIRFTMKMENGWNLGNSLDAHGKGSVYSEITEFETRWGNPIVSKAQIDALKKAGFSSIRIPITWYEHIDEKGNIDQLWLNRVNEVVDYAIDNRMYVIINTHHENWTLPSKDNKKHSTYLISKIWKQIAERFSTYDDHLLFEGFNEPRLIGTEHEWTGGTSEARKIVNEYNKVFVETVRKVAGNEKRYLIITPYGSAADLDAIKSLIIPKDSHIIVGIHAYKPYSFTHDENGTKNWSPKDKKDTAEIDTIMQNLNQYFIKKGIPVIITEFGCIDKDNLSARTEYTKYYVSAAKKNDIICFWWDDGAKIGKKEKFGIFDRNTQQFIYPELLKALLSV